MNLKKIIVLILFLSLLLIGSVSAADVSNDSQVGSNQIDKTSTDILTTENSDESQNINSINEVEKINTELTATNSNETLAASEITVNDYNQLYDQIENLKEQGTSKSYIINLNPKGDFTITDSIKLQGDNSPAKDFTINGNGATIDGKNSKYFLTIFENYSVTLNNLNFVDNLISKDGGGAIAIHTGGKLNVNNCNFTGCKALNETESIHAGALRIGFDAIVNINNSIFKKNSATYGAGAIVIGGTLTEYNTSPHPDLDPTTIAPTTFINNCQFIDNAAGHGGAINIEDFCTAIITNCTFKGNSAESLEFGLGGAICTDRSSYAILINNIFQNNTAKQSGGAICTDETSCLLSINNTFQNNIAENSGGGLYNAIKSQIKIDNNIFIKNEAVFGGAICNHDLTTLTVTDSLFTENTASNLGGAICTGKNNILTTTNTAFDKNKANLGGAICLSENSKMDADDVAFTQNSATSGGAIHGANNNNIVIKNIKLTDNIASENGGAILVGENTVIAVTNASFSRNKANLGGAILTGIDSDMVVDDIIFTQNGASSGGAIYAAKNNNLQIKNTEITDNAATATGGAILIGENNILTMVNTTFDKNKAKLGGAICLSTKSNMSADTTTFTQNNATSNGGAIYGANNNNIVIKNIKLTDNIASENGGAILVGENTVIAVTNASFSRNKANLGGAILTGIDSDMVVDDIIFTQNSASSGGAIYAAKNNNLQIKNTEITDNAATATGGAILIAENNTLITTNTIFGENKANIGGAIFSGVNSKITTNGTSFTQNMANTNGGAIITGENNTLTTTNTTFNANKANFGGAIFSGVNSKITTNGTSFTQNMANTNGGAIITGGNNAITTTNTIFGENKAALGGAICLSTNSEITADKNIFSKNNATKNGGAIYSTSDNVILMRNTEITNNVATSNGGAIYTGKTTTMTASDMTFGKNTAGNLGGAVCGDSESTVILSNSEFNDNIANMGKAIYNPKQGTLVLKGSTSIDADDYLNDGTLNIEDTVNTKISIDSIEYSSELIVEGKLVDEYGSPIIDETVSVIVENENIRAITDNNGKFIARFSNITPGTYRISSTYYGDSVYNKATVDITKKIVKRQQTRISVSDLSTTYNIDKDLIITLVNNQNSPLANMQITVDLGTGDKTYTTDNRGQVKISTKDLSVKTYIANIRFNGNDEYLQSNATAKITINKQTTKITATDIITTYNTNKDFVVTLTDGQNTPLTNFHITIDFGTGANSHTTDNNGQVKIPTNSLATDTYDVKIKYNGNENYEQSNTTAKITINKLPTQITATDVITIYNTNKYMVVTLKNNQNVVSDEMIIVTIGTSIKQYTTDNNGQVKISTNLLIPDTYEAKIRFNGNDDYMQSNTTAKITINKDTPKLTTSYNTNEFTVTFTNGQDSPLANMPLSINFGTGFKAYTTDNNGQVKISTSGFAPNTYDVKIIYNGNEKYIKINTTAKITIGQDSTKITAADVSTTYNINKDFVVTLTNGQNSPLANAAITVDLGTGPKGYTTDNNGQVKISTKDLSAKTYVVNIRFNGNDKYMQSNATAKIIINKQSTQITSVDVSTTYNINKDFVVTLTNGQNSPLANAAITVDWGSGPKTYSTDNNGQVKISTAGLVPKTYAVKIVFEGNDNYMKSSNEAKVIVKKATLKLTAKAATFKKSLKTKKFTVTLKNNKNKVMKKVKLTLKVNGKTYSATTNTKGKATFKITKLTKKGKFTASIKYNGNKYYNKLNKNVKITIK